MKKAPLSVIIPCHRAESTLERALDSICRQTVKPAQVIIVDDGSPEISAKKIDQICMKHKYAAPLHLTRYRLKDKTGPGFARNVGWKLSKYSHIAFLDADDAWHPQKLEIQYRWMLNHPDAALTSHKSSQINQFFDFSHQTANQPVKAKKITPLMQLLSNHIHTRTAMVKKDFPFRFAENRLHSEDYQLWLEIILNGFPSYLLDAELAYTFKPQYGASGLSSDLVQMELGELSSYYYCYKKRLISSAEFIGLMVWSFFKFGYRFIHTALRYSKKAE